MRNYQGLIDEWPTFSFDAIENIEIENKALRVFYRSFFAIIHTPETIYKAFKQLLTDKVS